MSKNKAAIQVAIGLEQHALHAARTLEANGFATSGIHAMGDEFDEDIVDAIEQVLDGVERLKRRVIGRAYDADELHFAE